MPWRIQGEQSKWIGNPNALAILPAARAIAAAAYPPIAPEIRELVACWRIEGQTLRTIAYNVNRLAIRTPRGEAWYASSVRNMVDFTLM